MIYRVMSVPYAVNSVNYLMFLEFRVSEEKIDALKTLMEPDLRNLGIPLCQHSCPLTSVSNYYLIRGRKEIMKCQDTAENSKRRLFVSAKQSALLHLFERRFPG